MIGQFMGYLPKLKRFFVDMEVTNAEKNQAPLPLFSVFSQSERRQNKPKPNSTEHLFVEKITKQ